MTTRAWAYLCIYGSKWECTATGRRTAQAESLYCRMLGLANVKQRLIVLWNHGQIDTTTFYLFIYHSFTITCFNMYIFMGFNVGDNLLRKGECVFFGSN